MKPTFFQTVMKRLKKKRVRKTVHKVKDDNSLKDINAVIDFLREVHLDIEKLLEKMKHLKILETERLVAKEGVLQVNLQAQCELMDELLKEYEMFADDTAISAIRVQHVKDELLLNLKKAGMKDLYKEKREDILWKREW